MGRDRFTMGFDHNNMTPANVGTAAIQVIWRTVDGVIDCWGTTVPTTVNTFAEGCIFHKVNASANDTLYVNNGTYASPSFEKVLSTGNVVDEIENDYLADTNAGVGPSPVIWDSAPWLEVMLDPAKGFGHFEDFMLPDVYATTVLNGGLLFTQQNGAGAVAALTTGAGGLLEMDTGTAAADDGPSVQFPGIQCFPQPGLVIYFEARVKVDNDAGDYFVGLSDSASVTSVLGTGTILTNKDHAGFFRDDGTTDANVSAQTCDGTNVTSEDDVVTDVDKDKYIKYGVVITGDGDTAGDNVKFYINGVLVKTVTDADAGGDDGIPDKVIAPLFEVHAHTTASIKMDLDWMRILVYHTTNGTARA